MSKSSLLLGEILLEMQAVSTRELEKALVAQQQMGGRLGGLLLRSGAVSETHLIDALHRQLGLPRLEHEVAIPAAEDILSCLQQSAIDPDWLLQENAVLWDEGDISYCFAMDFFSSFLNEVLTARVQGDVTFVLGRKQVLDALLSQVKLLLDAE